MKGIDKLREEANKKESISFKIKRYRHIVLLSFVISIFITLILGYRTTKNSIDYSLAIILINFVLIFVICSILLIGANRLITDGLPNTDESLLKAFITIFTLLVGIFSGIPAAPTDFISAGVIGPTPDHIESEFLHNRSGTHRSGQIITYKVDVKVTEDGYKFPEEIGKIKTYGKTRHFYFKAELISNEDKASLEITEDKDSDRITPAELSGDYYQLADKDRVLQADKIQNSEELNIILKTTKNKTLEVDTSTKECITIQTVVFKYKYEKTTVFGDEVSIIKQDSVPTEKIVPKDEAQENNTLICPENIAENHEEHIGETITVEISMDGANSQN